PSPSCTALQCPLLYTLSLLDALPIFHVDAASGGFLAPFCAPDLVWDFRLPRVKSINTSGHKYGLAPLGCGWVDRLDARQTKIPQDRKSTRLNSSHVATSYAGFCLQKK